MNATPAGTAGGFRRPFTTPALCALALAASVGTSRAELVTYDVDPARSEITMSGTTSGSVLVEQSAGSLTTTFSGTILAEVTDSQIRFPGGGLVKATEKGAYTPLAGGEPGTAPGAYGAKANVTVVIFSVVASAAARQVGFDLESLAIARNGAAFDSKGLTFRIPESAGTKLDYRTSGGITLKGSSPVTGLAPNQSAAGSLATVDGVETLTVPFDASYFFDLASPKDTEMKFKGVLVATRRAVAPPPVVVITPPKPGSPDLTLTWPAGYKLQHSFQLTPPDWKDLPSPSPFTVPPALPGEYFRIVPVQ